MAITANDAQSAVAAGQRCRRTLELMSSDSKVGTTAVGQGHRDGQQVAESIEVGNGAPDGGLVSTSTVPSRVFPVLLVVPVT